MIYANKNGRIGFFVSFLVICFVSGHALGAETKFTSIYTDFQKKEHRRVPGGRNLPHGD